MKMKFKNIFNRENLQRVISPAGSHFEEVKRWRIDENGKLIRKVVKVENIYDRIQAARDSVDLQLILQRYENGDASALDKVQGMYFDSVDLPKNIHEMYQAIMVHDDVFNSMPVEVKDKFNNSAAEFWSAFGTEYFDETLNKYRSEIFGRYGREDPDPVNTVDNKIKELNDIVDKTFEKVEEGNDNE